MTRHKVKDSVNVCRIGWTLLEKEVEKSEPNKPSKIKHSKCASVVYILSRIKPTLCVVCGHIGVF